MATNWAGSAAPLMPERSSVASTSFQISAARLNCLASNAASADLRMGASAFLSSSCADVDALADDGASELATAAAAATTAGAVGAWRVAKRSQPSLATCATHALGLMATPSLVASATSTACSLGADGLADAKAAAKRAESSMHVAAEATGHSTASVYAGSSSWWM